jgi:type IV secretory pathway VirB2 component (pilin)
LRFEIWNLINVFNFLIYITREKKMKNVLQKGFIALSTIGATAITYGTAFAVAGNVAIDRPTSISGLPQDAEKIILQIITYALGVAGLVAVIFLIMGGFQYITAQGNEDQTKKATGTLLNAVVGLIIIFAAFAIVYTVQKNIIGVDETILIK